MCPARDPNDERITDRALTGRRRLVAPAVRKPGRMLRPAVTVATAGLLLALPIGAQAQARVNPAVAQRLGLDRGTMRKLHQYEKYRTKEAIQARLAKKALRFGYRQIGKPYRWGAAGPRTYDCSGLAMVMWRKAGVKLPRVTYDQYRSVRRKVGLHRLRPGDLIFFHGRGHVGIYVGKGRFLHAPHTGARVRIDRLNAFRKSQFAGAVRPSAPAYHRWPRDIKRLARQVDHRSGRHPQHRHRGQRHGAPPGRPVTAGPPDSQAGSEPKGRPVHQSAALQPGAPPFSAEASRPEPRPVHAKQADVQQTRQGTAGPRQGDSPEETQPLR